MNAQVKTTTPRNIILAELRKGERTWSELIVKLKRYQHPDDELSNVLGQLYGTGAIKVNARHRSYRLKN